MRGEEHKHGTGALVRTMREAAASRAPKGILQVGLWLGLGLEEVFVFGVRVRVRIRVSHRK